MPYSSANLMAWLCQYWVLSRWEFELTVMFIYPDIPSHLIMSGRRKIFNVIALGVLFRDFGPWECGLEHARGAYEPVTAPSLILPESSATHVLQVLSNLRTYHKEVKLGGSRIRMMGVYFRSFKLPRQRCSQMGVIEWTEVLRLCRIRGAY